TRLAGGEYPQDLEEQLAPRDVSLLPRGPSELSHDCSCLDWPGPCRHVAALVYVLVEAVDERPLHLLTLRGLTLEDLVAPDGAAGHPGDADLPAFDPRRTDPALLAEVIGEPAAAAIASFYHHPDLQ